MLTLMCPTAFTTHLMLRDFQAMLRGIMALRGARQDCPRIGLWHEKRLQAGSLWPRHPGRTTMPNRAGQEVLEKFALEKCNSLNIIIRSPYTPYSIYFRGGLYTPNRAPWKRWRFRPPAQLAAIHKI